ncbi:hypothetical protein B0H13DRAFT_2474775 [Mycena leptocephala]|nr:hypothetical protein B0H13DRAFT_2474775 [Mycena leptocephala]
MDSYLLSETLGLISNESTAYSGVVMSERVREQVHWKANQDNICSQMRKMFSVDGVKLVQDHIPDEQDGLVNTILMDVRIYGPDADYRFGIWPVKPREKWRGRIFWFEQNGCQVNGQWLLAPVPEVKFPRPGFGRRESEEHPLNREREEQERKDNRTQCDLTEEPMLCELLKPMLMKNMKLDVGSIDGDKLVMREPRNIELDIGQLPVEKGVEEVLKVVAR